MVRRHGWQLPLHTFQVVAITVFFLLTIAYYVFFAPFLGSKALEYVAIAVYTPVALGVFLLYIRCTGIDPSDPGILAGDNITNQDKHSLALNSVVASVGRTPQSSNAWSSSVIQSDKESNSKVVGAEEGRNGLEIRGQRTSRLSSLGLGCFLCGLLVKEDSCRGSEDHQQPTTDEDILFCTLCNTEVQKYSKHCRSCDKCVDKFDHHCRWLNNCVGRKNYVSFVALMALGLMLLLLDCGVGIAVFVRCFVDRKGTEKQIIENLGNSFSRVPFATIVAVCSVVSLLSSIPLGELFFFHIILIRKGITTYEYVVAMRAQGDPQGTAEGDERSLPSSPTSSTATGLSGSSSLGLQYRGAWCTPPRVFVEYQDEVMPHLGPGMVPSTIDPDAASVGGGSGGGPKPDISGRSRKRAVRISAWKLAKLNPGDAARAAAKARENSSVLRPLGLRDSALSGNASSRSSMSTDRGYPMVGSTRSRRGDLVFSPNMAGRAIIGRDGGDRGGGGLSQSSYYSSPAGGSSVYNPSASMSPLSGPPVVVPRHPPSSLPFPYVGSSSYTHRGHLYEVSSNESVDTSVTLSDRNGGGGEEEESNKRASVLWDERAGKFVSVSIPSPHNSLPSFLNPFRRPKPQTEIPQVPSSTLSSTLSSILPIAKIPSVSGSTSEAAPPPPAPPSGEGNLVYSETSIFFGGPLNVLVGPAARKEEESSPPPKKTSVGAATASERKEIRLPRGSAVARSQSPVFAPRSALPPLVSNNASTTSPLPKPSR